MPSKLGHIPEQPESELRPCSLPKIKRATCEEFYDFLTPYDILHVDTNFKYSPSEHTEEGCF